MVYRTEQQQVSGEGGRIESQVEDSTKDDLSNQEKPFVFSKGSWSSRLRLQMQKI